jgi:hypothetical protein
MDDAGINSKDAVTSDFNGGKYCQSDPKVPAKKVTGYDSYSRTKVLADIRR